MTSPLSRLTIVIPTSERHGYALRNMRYWSGSDVRVLVADGSASPVSMTDREGFGHNIEYHHLPRPMLQRLRMAADRVQTDFAMILGDDEFFLPSGLIACIRELDADASLVACTGRCMAFRSAGGIVQGWPKYEEMIGYKVRHDDRIGRMIAHMDPYACSTIYGVARTPAWRTAMHLLTENTIAVRAVEELQFELALAYLGNSKVIDELTWLRSMENPASENRGARFDRWWRDGTQAAERSRFVDAIAVHLAGATPELVPTMRAAIERALEGYVQFVERDRRHQWFAGTGQRLIARIPAAMRSRLRRGLSAIGKPDALTRARPLIDAAREMNRNGVGVDFEQLERIRDIVSVFHDAQQRPRTGS